MTGVKLGYPVATPETVAAVHGMQGHLSDGLSTLREHKYDGIEACVRNVDSFSASAFESFVRGYGLEIAAIGTGPMVGDDGLSFTAGAEEVREEAIRRMLRAVDWASVLGAVVCIGKVRGNLTRERAEAGLQMREAIERVCEHAERKNVTVVLEPQNRSIIQGLTQQKRPCLLFAR